MMMPQHTFRVPPIICSSCGAASRAGELIKGLKGKSPLLVTDNFLMKSGLLKPVTDALEEAGIKFVIYDGVNSEPTLQHVKDGLELLKKENCDSLISCGGGSPIDTAKALAALAVYPGEVTDYMGRDKVPGPCLPHIAIPTTAGTGSEVTATTIITDTVNDVKMLIISPYLIPNAAIVDPLLTLGMPPGITAATGLDALTHAIEAYVSIKAQPMSDIFAISAIQLLAKNLPMAWANPGCVEARANTLLGALQAGIAFSNSSVALVHGMSRPIGAIFHVAHGVSNAALLGVVTEFSLAGNAERYAAVGQAMGLKTHKLPPMEAAQKTAEAVNAIIKLLEVPTLTALGVSKDNLDQWVDKMATDALASGSPDNNPRKASKEQIIKLYYQAL